MAPGVYQYWGVGGQVIYVGKAKSLRRRLANYRDATRKRIHRKQRVIVSESLALTYEVCTNEEQALLLESKLIRKLRPSLNVQGAYAFLYPFFGFQKRGGDSLLCFTTGPERYEELGFDWYGCFRSRPRAKAAFEALIELLSLVAHREKTTRLPPHPKLRGSRLVGFRQMPPGLDQALQNFLAGEGPSFLTELSTRLLEKPRARNRASTIEARLRELLHFHQVDAKPLTKALKAVGQVGTHIGQDERDDLFIRAEFLRRDD